MTRDGRFHRCRQDNGTQRRHREQRVTEPLVGIVERHERVWLCARRFSMILCHCHKRGAVASRRDEDVVSL